jgi:hypothetical protein
LSKERYSLLRKERFLKTILPWFGSNKKEEGKIAFLWAPHKNTSAQNCKESGKKLFIIAKDLYTLTLGLKNNRVNIKFQLIYRQKIIGQ